MTAEMCYALSVMSICIMLSYFAWAIIEPKERKRYHRRRF